MKTINSIKKTLLFLVVLAACGHPKAKEEKITWAIYGKDSSRVLRDSKGNDSAMICKGHSQWVSRFPTNGDTSILAEWKEAFWEMSKQKIHSDGIIEKLGMQLLQRPEWIGITDRLPTEIKWYCVRTWTVAHGGYYCESSRYWDGEKWTGETRPDAMEGVVIQWLDTSQTSNK